MFGRRRIQERRLRRAWRRNLGRPGAQEAMARLQQAHQAMAKGDFPQAAGLFEGLATQGETFGIRSTPALLIQAGRARLMAGDVTQATAHFERGLMLMAEVGRVLRLPIVAGSILAEMRARGLTAEADALEIKVRRALGVQALAPQPAASGPRPQLPPKCPQCGGTVHPQEVEWIDSGSAVCDYCGSVLEGEA